MAPQNLQILREKLREHYGAIEEIRYRAAHLNGDKPFHRNYVRMVLKGERNNHGILAVAAQVAVEFEEKKKQNEQMVSKAVAALATC